MEASPVETGGDTKLKRLRQWQAGNTAGPWDVLVMPTNRCNLKCKHCWERRAETETGNAIYDKAQEMSDQRLLELVDECHQIGVREWNIVGGGEPMVRGDLVMDMCQKIRRLGMNGVIHSNGTRFTQDHWEHLVKIRWGRVAVSLDGPNPAINDAIRGTGFDKAIHNLRQLDDLRRSHRVEWPRVNLACAITNTNFDTVDAMVQLAHDTGCRTIGVSFLTEENDACESYDLTPEQRAEFPSHLNRAIDVADRLGIENNFADLLSHDLEAGRATPGMAKTCAGDGRMTDANCYEVWLSAAIHVDGRVGPCCVSWDEAADSIVNKTFEEVWYGPHLQHVRDRIVTPALMPYCAKCPTFVGPLSGQLRLQITRQEQWAAMGIPQRVGYLGKRFASSLKGAGLKQTLRRTRTWIQARKT